jgi:tetratricopeptide (TPR) repeat protein
MDNNTEIKPIEKAPSDPPVQINQPVPATLAPAQAPVAQEQTAGVVAQKRPGWMHALRRSLVETIRQKMRKQSALEPEVLPPVMPAAVSAQVNMEVQAMALSYLQKKREPPSLLARFAEFFNVLRVLFSTLLIFALLLVLVISFWKEYDKAEAVVINPINMPAKLEEKGFTSDVIAHKIADQINFIKKTAGTTKQDEHYRLPDKGPDIEVPQANISVNSFVKYIGGLVDHEKRMVGGDVVMLDGERVRLTVRISLDDGILYPERHKNHMILGRHEFWKDFQSDRIIFVESYEGELKDLDNLAYEAAKKILHYNDPYVLSAFLYENDKQACLQELEYCLSQEPKNDDPWAYVLRGNVLDEMQDYSGAVAMYRQAIAEQRKLTDSENSSKTVFSLGYNNSEDSSNTVFSLAYNNWASLLEEIADLPAQQRNALNYSQFTEEATPISSLTEKDYYDAALHMYEKATTCDSNYPIAYIGIGDVLRKEKRYAEAKENYQKTTVLDSQHSWGYQGLGDVEMALNNYRDAIDKYELAIRLENPKRSVGSIRESMEEAFGCWIEEMNLKYPGPQPASGDKKNRASRRSLAALAKQAAAEAPNLDKITLNMAYAYKGWADLEKTLGKVKEARERYQKAIYFAARLTDGNQLGGELKDAAEKTIKDLSLVLKAAATK